MRVGDNGGLQGRGISLFFDGLAPLDIVQHSGVSCCLGTERAGALFRPLLYLFGASEVTYPYASSYIVIYLLGTLCVMLSLGLNPYINCQGFARTGMLTVALVAAANIVLDPIFIFALHLGVRGAAIATVLSQLLSAAWVVKFLTGKKAGFPRFPAGLALHPAHYRARHRQLRHVVYGYARAGGVQFHAARFRRRPVHQRHDRT